MEPEHQERRPTFEAIYEAPTPSLRDVILTETRQFDAVHEALIHPLRENSLTENEQSATPNATVTIDEKATKKPPTRRWNNIRNWWLEILCLCVVNAALLAIIVTLSTHNDRPLPEWPYKVSVNTLVAVYVVILKGAMLLIVTEGTSAPHLW